MRREVAPGDRMARDNRRVSVQADGSTQPHAASDLEIDLEDGEEVADLLTDDADVLEDDAEDECLENSTMNASANETNASNATTSGPPSSECRRRRSETAQQPGDSAWPGGLSGRRRCDNWCRWLCNGQGLQCRRRTVLDWRRRSACWRRRQYTWRRRGTAIGENTTEGAPLPPAAPCEYFPWRRRSAEWRRRSAEWRRRDSAIGEPFTMPSNAGATKIASDARPGTAKTLTIASTVAAETADAAQEGIATPAAHNMCWRRRTAEWRRRSPMWRRRWNCPGTDSTITTTPCEPNGTAVDYGWGSPENIESAAPAGAVAEPVLSAALQQAG